MSVPASAVYETIISLDSVQIARKEGSKTEYEGYLRIFGEEERTFVLDDRRNSSERVIRTV